MLRRKMLSLAIISNNCLKVKSSFHQKLFQKKKLLLWIYKPCNFQVICGSMVGENCLSLTSTKTPEK